MSMSLPDCALALDVRDRDAALDGGMHDRGLVRDRVGDVAAQRLVNVGGTNGAHQALFEPVDDDAQVDRREVLLAQQIQLAAGAVKAAHAQLGDEQHQVGLREQRQRPVGPVRGQIDEDRPELALRNFDDLDQLLAGHAIPAASMSTARRPLSARSDARSWSPEAVRRRGELRLRSGRRTSGCGRRPSWNAALPNWRSRSSRQTSRPTRCSFAAALIASCVSKRRCADPAHALDHADHLAVRGLGRRRIALHLVADRQQATSRDRRRRAEAERRRGPLPGPARGPAPAAVRKRRR